MVKRFAKTDRTGRTQSGDKFAKMFLVTMQCSAWQALSPYAQRLYPWLLHEWNGPKANNNGRISLSVRQAAEALRCNRETARLAFHDLQAKGFLVLTRCAALGTVGAACSHAYEITELGTAETPIPRKCFRGWKPGHDFPTVKAKSNNPRGIGGIQNLESQLTDGASNGRPQLTDGACPNLPDRPDRAKNTDSPTYGVSHPYLPEGVGDAAVDRTDAGTEPAKPAQPSPEPIELKRRCLPSVLFKLRGFSAIHCFGRWVRLRALR